MADEEVERLVRFAVETEGCTPDGGGVVGRSSRGGRNTLDTAAVVAAEEGARRTGHSRTSAVAGRAGDAVTAAASAGAAHEGVAAAEGAEHSGVRKDRTLVVLAHQAEAGVPPTEHMKAGVRTRAAGHASTRVGVAGAHSALAEAAAAHHTPDTEAAGPEGAQPDTYGRTAQAEEDNAGAARPLQAVEAAPPSQGPSVPNSPPPGPAQQGSSPPAHAPHSLAHTHPPPFASSARAPPCSRASRARHRSPVAPAALCARAPARAPGPRGPSSFAYPARALPLLRTYPAPEADRAADPPPRQSAQFAQAAPNCSGTPWTTGAVVAGYSPSTLRAALASVAAAVSQAVGLAAS